MLWGGKMKFGRCFSHWEKIREGLIETIDKFKDAELDYVPFDGSRAIGDMILHIADAEDGWFRYVVTRELDEWPTQYTLTNYPGRNGIRGALDEVHERTERYLVSLSTTELDKVIEAPWGEQIPLRWIIGHVLEHEVHHRGELSLILGLLGREGLDV
jgi:uncharacterized damage-inducible protein DinB